MSISPRISLHISLRWLRRTMTMVLILSNFAATLLADHARGGSTDLRLIASLLTCLCLIILTRTVAGKKAGPILKSPVSFIG